MRNRYDFVYIYYCLQYFLQCLPSPSSLPVHGVVCQWVTRFTKSRSLGVVCWSETYYYYRYSLVARASVFPSRGRTVPCHRVVAFISTRPDRAHNHPDRLGTVPPRVASPVAASRPGAEKRDTGPVPLGHRAWTHSDRSCCNAATQNRIKKSLARAFGAATTTGSSSGTTKV